MITARLLAYDGPAVRRHVSRHIRRQQQHIKEIERLRKRKQGCAEIVPVWHWEFSYRSRPGHFFPLARWSPRLAVPATRRRT